LQKASGRFYLHYLFIYFCFSGLEACVFPTGPFFSLFMTEWWNEDATSLYLPLLKQSFAYFYLFTGF